MALTPFPVDPGEIRGAFGSLAQVNFQNAERRRARRQRQTAIIGALAGAGVGLLAAPLIAPGVGALQAAGAGAGIGSSLFTGDALGAGTGLLGLGGMAEQAQAGQAVQGALGGMRTPVIPEVGATGTVGDLSPQDKERNALLGAFGGIARTRPDVALQGALRLRTPAPERPEFGFTNVPGAGLVRTEKRTGTATPTGIGGGEGPAAPAGYRWNADRSALEAVPGGPADPSIKPKEDPFFAGKGLGIADSRNLASIGPKIISGTAEPAETDAYTLSWIRATRPEVQTITDEDGRPSTIQRPALNLPADRFPPPPGMGSAAQAAPTAGAPGQGPRGAAGIAGATTVGTRKAPIPMEAAGKLSSLQVAKGELARARAAFIKEDGSVDREAVLSTYAGLPGTDGRVTQQRMRRALEAKLRADSGAAVPESEVTRYLGMYLPSPFDGDEGVVNKLDSFQAYIDGAIDLATFGRGLVSEDLLKKVEKNQERSRTTESVPKADPALQRLRQQFGVQPVN